ncbi:unnamed protein product, partial [Owenia fusiformis]
MASNREKYYITNTLLCLLKACENKKTIVELRNENIVEGLINYVDGFMNVTMSDVKFTSFRGDVSMFESFFVAGKNIRFVQIPDEIDMMAAIKAHAARAASAANVGLQETKRNPKSLNIWQQKSEASKLAQMKQMVHGSEAQMKMVQEAQLKMDSKAEAHDRMVNEAEAQMKKLHRTEAIRTDRPIEPDSSK